MKNRIIAYTCDGYPERRNFLNLPFDGVLFKRKLDFYTLIRKINNYKGALDWYTQFTHKPIKFLEFNIKGYHFFNTISVGSKPYIVTFETRIPRWTERIDEGLNILNRRNCIAMVAISDRAYGLQHDFIVGHFLNPEGMLKKLIKIPPAQDVLLDSKNLDTSCTVKFIFVGNLFFLKGGYELILGIDALIKAGRNVELTIVSTLEVDDWCTNSNETHVKEVKNIVERHSASIQVLSSLSNDDVLEMFKSHHVALLPSFADTYGYSVLEAMACMCPVITTNVGALTEINSNERGWIIDLPLNEYGSAILPRDSSSHFFSEKLYHGLKRVLLEIVDDPSTINNKAIKARDYIRSNHSPDSIAKKYAELYDKF